jgi:hypothetical protein
MESPSQQARRRVWLHPFAVGVVLMALIPLAQPAHADTAQCFQTLTGTVCATFPPPDLLNLLPRANELVNLQPGLYTATVTQTAALQNLETQAITTTEILHGLPATDYNAVKSWGRGDAEATLYGLLLQAITTTATSRTAVQQNAVDWLEAVAQRQQVAAAEDAGREYATWAGLDLSHYQVLADNAGTNESALQTYFANGLANNNNAAWCAYHSPAPYDTEYTASSNPTVCLKSAATPPGSAFRPYPAMTSSSNGVRQTRTTPY